MATFDYFNTASPEKIKAVGGGRTKIAVAPERLKLEGSNIQGLFLGPGGTIPENLSPLALTSERENAVRI